MKERCRDPRHWRTGDKMILLEGWIGDGDDEDEKELTRVGVASDERSTEGGTLPSPEAARLQGTR